ncbi:MAG: CPBP family intramembrane metalloprotease [Rhodocyclaceae bacterium]|nr:CPBP family intramembrane metalloprotease [Rhodocyclaceae bacterium]
MRALWAMPHPLRPHGLRLGLLLLAGGLLLAVLLPWLPFPLAPFALPREQPSLWLAAILLYPLLSAFPQEFIFRVFFFHRYQALGLRPSRMIAASAMSFALAHAQFGNWPAVALSFLGGLLFAYTYARTRSWLLVGAEHGLWGDWLLTLGFAPYFYGGFI